MDFKIQQLEQDGQEVYFTLLRDDGAIGKLQLNMWFIIHNRWCDVIEWEE